MTNRHWQVVGYLCQIDHTLVPFEDSDPLVTVDDVKKELTNLENEVSKCYLAINKLQREAADYQGEILLMKKTNRILLDRIEALNLDLGIKDNQHYQD
jgi:hypothetical protein